MKTLIKLFLIFITNTSICAQTIFDVVKTSESHTTLETAIVASGLDKSLSNPDADLTLFAPTDDAFSALPTDLLNKLLSDPTGKLSQILLSHVAESSYLSPQLSDDMKIKMLQENETLIKITDGMVKINNAKVIVSDIKASNGVVHVIDAVLSTSFNNSSSDMFDLDKSFLEWKAYKVTGSHEGTLKLSEIDLDFVNGQISGGTVKVDMTTIQCTDLSGNGKNSLEGHLMSEDFFSVDDFPFSKIIIDDIKLLNETYQIKATITIKGHSEKIEFDAVLHDNMITSNIKIDRTKFNIKYGSGSFFDDLGDNMIYDEFDLSITLVMI
tara:strand:+ start:6857 stop:7831 length:975 start_codon:yes stop_codon:yes gene_type:complete